MKALSWYRALNILSLDVAVGAVVGALFFATVFQVMPRIAGLLALGLSVWIIYTTDHLLDARRSHGKAATRRHRFHQVHFKLLVRCWFVAVAVDALLLFFIRASVLKGGLLLAVFVLFYFVALRFLRFMKEFIGAWLYTTGVMLLSVPVTPVQITVAHVMLMIQFFLTALFNLILFSWMDRANDLQSHHDSFATVLGERAARYFLLMVATIQLLLLVWQTAHELWIESGLIAIMQGVLLLMFVTPRYFKVKDRFRVWGDAIFFLPTIYLVCKYLL